MFFFHILVWRFDDFSWGNTRLVQGEMPIEGDHEEVDYMSIKFDQRRIRLLNFPDWVGEICKEEYRIHAEEMIRLEQLQYMKEDCYGYSDEYEDYKEEKKESDTYFYEKEEKDSRTFYCNNNNIIKDDDNNNNNNNNNFKVSEYPDEKPGNLHRFKIEENDGSVYDEDD